MPIAGICPNATSKHQAFVDEVNDAPLRVSPTESTALWMILKHMLEQTQIRGRMSLDEIARLKVACANVDQL